MKLDVIPPTRPPSSTPWYAGGLQFTCTQCGNCCTGGPGYVWISEEEVQRLAEFFKLSVPEVLRKYCRTIRGRISLKERRMPNGNYDCIFLKELTAETKSNDRQLEPGEPIPTTRYGCAIYPVRPLQCRTWPFWETNLSGREMWDFAAGRCPGMNSGSRKFTREQIESLRNATDWPEDPPTSSEK
ncbi:MAG TPA: YkgJ family cysteine cluster protein [Tepidisphaeraceae bacterium]|nr:YkgJ family cysteine cluster protein [Tepidisphaeraceae bacterium]